VGFLDAPVAGLFKTTEDGRRLFFPGGVLGRGYAVDSAERFERLRRRATGYHALVLLLILATIAWFGHRGAAALLPVAIVSDVLWQRFQCLGLEPTREKLSFREVVTAQAHAQDVVVLWLLALWSLVAVGLGVFVLVRDPGKWLVAVAAIVFFGFGAGVFGMMLASRRRAAGARP
jgi:hypothetical protein